MQLDGLMLAWAASWRAASSSVHVVDHPSQVGHLILEQKRVGTQVKVLVLEAVGPAGRKKHSHGQGAPSGPLGDLYGDFAVLNGTRVPPGESPWTVVWSRQRTTLDHELTTQAAVN